MGELLSTDVVGSQHTAWLGERPMLLLQSVREHCRMQMHPQLMHCSHECPQLRSSRGQSKRAPQMAQLAASSSAEVAASASTPTLAPSRPAIWAAICACQSSMQNMSYAGWLQRHTSGGDDGGGDGSCGVTLPASEPATHLCSSIKLRGRVCVGPRGSTGLSGERAAAAVSAGAVDCRQSCSARQGRRSGSLEPRRFVAGRQPAGQSRPCGRDCTICACTATD